MAAKQCRSGVVSVGRTRRSAVPAGRPIAGTALRLVRPTDSTQILSPDDALVRHAYFSKHVADETSFRCDANTNECRMDIDVCRMANISDMNVQATGIAAGRRDCD